MKMGTLARLGRQLRTIGTRWEELARDDSRLLLAMLSVVFCVWVFVVVSDSVTSRRTQHIDDRVMRALRDPEDLSTPRGPAWLPAVMRDITSLGSLPVLALFVLAVAGSLVVRRQRHALVLVLVATAGGEGLNLLLKGLFHRPRPDVVLHLTPVNSPSFPSGHAMESAVIYFTLAALLARLVEPRPLKLYFLALAAFLSFIVGLSRVYLGVHYPTDVLAGWTAGIAWALVCWTVASRLQREGSVEPAK
jgi:undecaprenyl-diphosphatase